MLTVLLQTKWDCNISSIINKAQQRMYFLRQLRNLNLSQELMVQFYTGAIESVITSSVTVWSRTATKHDIRRLQHIIRSAEKTPRVKLPTLLDLHTSRTRKHAEKITDPAHPGHHLFQRLPSGCRFSQIRIKTARLERSFFPHAISLMNSYTTVHVTLHIRDAFLTSFSYSTALLLYLPSPFNYTGPPSSSPLSQTGVVGSILCLCQIRTVSRHPGCREAGLVLHPLYRLLGLTSEQLHYGAPSSYTGPHSGLSRTGAPSSVPTVSDWCSILCTDCLGLVLHPLYRLPRTGAPSSVPTVSDWCSILCTDCLGLVLHPLY
ncbi:hypothetical protein NFI96_005245 [Prochilodus magdalenae]|nr:hypothetical protein NFI96_005245 [Prochilodus magdalenae]